MNAGMSNKEFHEWRKELNELMFSHSPFLRQFNQIDSKTYLGGAIPVKYKELMGLALAVGSRCDQCVRYHTKMCVETGATLQEMVEAIDIAIITAGSWSFPQARLAFECMRELGVVPPTGSGSAQS